MKFLFCYTVYFVQSQMLLPRGHDWWSAASIPGGGMPLHRDGGPRAGTRARLLPRTEQVFEQTFLNIIL